MSKITYSTKSDINTNATPEVNKVTAADMNEIKNVVNNNDDALTNTNVVLSNIKGTVLWTNPNPTADFSEQYINLSSSDYDVLEFYYRSDISGNRASSTRVLKGYGIEFDMYSTSSATRTWRRRASFTNDTKYHFENCGQLEQGQTTSTHNEYCVPLYVIGYKTGLF